MSKPWIPKENEIIKLTNYNRINMKASIGATAYFNGIKDGYWHVKWVRNNLSKGQMDGGYYPEMFGPNTNDVQQDKIDTLTNHVQALYLQSRLDLALMSVAANQEFNSIEEVCDYIRELKERKE